mmetsp:Transcript_33424/g.65862  ORF Transcript_33424/g.65862 Transcript_33424/m.65862 type:complete len:622 (+) Transcript_33424:86-1951(+)
MDPAEVFGGRDSGGQGSGPVAPGSAGADEFAAEVLEERRQRRLAESQTGIGLRDWTFDAAALIADSLYNLETEFVGLQELVTAIETAALTLNDENWSRFKELPADRVHCMDYEVNTGLFVNADLNWKPLLALPKAGADCMFLHIGTSATSTPLGDFLDKQGWFGVSVCLEPPAQHLHEKILQVPLDPTRDEHDEEFKKLATKRGGRVPKPKYFKLAYLKVLFKKYDAALDSDNDDDGKNSQIPEQENPLGQAVTSVARMAKGPLAESAQPELTSAAVGYGLLGVTRGTPVRRRLRALRNALAATLARLDDGGGLVFTWPGLPFHPVLLFVTKYLRGLFTRLHLLTPENIQSWEVYVLGVGFKRDRLESAGKGGGAELTSFFDCSLRHAHLDDVLLWTLTPQSELKEARGEKSSKVKGYDDLWRTYAGKLNSLAHELGNEVTTEVASRRRRPARKRPAAAQPKPKPKPKPQGNSVAEPPPAAGQAATAPPEAPAAPSRKVQRAPPDAGDGIDGKDGRAGSDQGKPTKPRPLLQTSRSMPWLACSLGAAPGTSYVGFPDRTSFTEQWPELAHALDCAERHPRRWHRRRLAGEKSLPLLPGPHIGKQEVASAPPVNGGLAQHVV